MSLNICTNTGWHAWCLEVPFIELMILTMVAGLGFSMTLCQRAVKCAATGSGSSDIGHLGEEGQDRTSASVLLLRSETCASRRL